jgi:epsilon-lactone hydrolase
MTSRQTTVAGIPALHLEPKGHKAEGHLLFLHGGGYAIGSSATHRTLAARLALGASMSATVLDYRLAPEHPYPAGLDDCLAAYESLLEVWGPQSLAIAGDSAGGGATLATLLRIRDRGVAAPAAAVMFSPWVDLTGTSVSMRERAGVDPMLKPRHLERFGDWYVNGVSKDNIEVSPMFAELHGLPPMLVMVGSDEVLFDDSVTLVKRVNEAGGQATLDIADGMWHVYQLLAPVLPEANSALAMASRFLVRNTVAA